MATRTRTAKTVDGKTVEIVDGQTEDFTGKNMTDKDKPVKAEITVNVNGKVHVKSVPLDMSLTVLDSFTAFLADPTDETRQGFGQFIPRKRAATDTSAENTTGWYRDILAGLTPEQRKSIDGYDPKQITPDAEGKSPRGNLPGKVKTSIDALPAEIKTAALEITKAAKAAKAAETADQDNGQASGQAA